MDNENENSFFSDLLQDTLDGLSNVGMTYLDNELNGPAVVPQEGQDQTAVPVGVFAGSAANPGTGQLGGSTVWLFGIPFNSTALMFGGLALSAVVLYKVIR